MSDAHPMPDAGLKQRILAEQVALMCRLTTLPLFGSIFIGAIITYIAFDDSGPRASLAWYAGSLIIMLIRWRVAHAYLARPRTQSEVRHWKFAMLALVAVFGAVWSIPPVFLMPTDPVGEVIMSVMFVGATAAGIGSLAPVRHAYMLLLVPFTLPYGINQFLLGDDRWLIGLAFLLYLPVMVGIAYRQTDSIERQLRLAIENETLASDLRTERDKVSDTNRELREQVDQHRHAVDRIRKLNQDLERQAIELRTANSDLEGFSYTVSHDLRAPLRAIDGFSSLLKEKNGSPHEAKESEHYMQRIRENIVRMSTLIDDLLAFARCGRQAVDMVELQMSDLAHAAANEALSTYAARATPEIVIEKLPAARGDESLLLQVWVNLLDNAVKYSCKADQPRIVIRGREEAGRLVYEVIDNGAGFDSRYQDRLFAVFHRLHGPQEYPGTGVGLAIVHRIVTRHGGEVWATSEINQGATFGFALPKAVAESGLTAVTGGVPPGERLGDHA